MMISLSWVLWFVAVFSFPITIASADKDFSRDSISSLNGPAQIQFNSNSELLEIPEFKVDWSLNARLNPDWYFDSISPSGVYLSSSFFKKSTPLFDVKVTFIHFFHTW